MGLESLSLTAPACASRTEEEVRSGRVNGRRRGASPSARTVYDANPAVDPGTEVLVSKGSNGFSVTVTRVMTMPDGRVIRQPYTHRYRGALRKYEKHPCDLFADVDCPVLVPGVVGTGQAAAMSALAEAGFLVALQERDVTDPGQDGIVLEQSRSGFQPAGSTVTITVGVLAEG